MLRCSDAQRRTSVDECGLMDQSEGNLEDCDADSTADTGFGGESWVL
jgi:hypothetical protein